MLDLLILKPSLRFLSLSFYPPTLNNSLQVFVADLRFFNLQIFVRSFLISTGILGICKDQGRGGVLWRGKITAGLG